MERPEISRDDNEHDYITRLETYIDHLEARITILQEGLRLNVTTIDVLRNALKRPVIIGKRDEFDEEET